MGEGRRSTIRWVPSSAAQLSARRRLVRPEEASDIGLEQIIFAAFAIVVPIWGFVDPTPRGRLALVPVGLLFGLAYVWSRRGIYLSAEGVTVQRGLIPRRPVPWRNVGEFRLAPRRLPLGGGDQEVVSLATADGTVIHCWALARRADFDTGRFTVESAKDFLRSFPHLVNQLNSIVAEVRAVG